MFRIHFSRLILIFFFQEHCKGCRDVQCRVCRSVNFLWFEVPANVAVEEMHYGLHALTRIVN